MSSKMTDRECIQACTAKGAQYVLVSEGKVYKLTNHDGKGDTIRVARIEMPKNPK